MKFWRVIFEDLLHDYLRFNEQKFVSNLKIPSQSGNFSSFACCGHLREGLVQVDDAFYKIIKQICKFLTSDATPAINGFTDTGSAGFIL